MQQTFNSSTHSAVLIEDHVYEWEKWTKTAIMTLPHARFENVAILALSGKSCTAEYLSQMVSFISIMVVLWLTENYENVMNLILITLKRDSSNLRTPSRTNLPDEVELSDSMLSVDSDENNSYPKKRHQSRPLSPENISMLTKADPMISFENLSKEFNGFTAVD